MHGDQLEFLNGGECIYHSNILVKINLRRYAQIPTYVRICIILHQILYSETGQ